MVDRAPTAAELGKMKTLATEAMQSAHLAYLQAFTMHQVSMPRLTR